MHSLLAPSYLTQSLSANIKCTGIFNSLRKLNSADRKLTIPGNKNNLYNNTVLLAGCAITITMNRFQRPYYSTGTFNPGKNNYDANISVGKYHFVSISSKGISSFQHFSIT